MGVYVMAASAVFSAFSSMSAAKNQKKAAEYQAQVARNNKQVSDWKAEDALRRGDIEASDHRRKVSQMKGSQVATAASRGVSLDSGSTANMLSDTDLFGAIDENKIKLNAKRQAWAFNVEGNNQEANAQAYESAADSINPGMVGFGSLLTSAGSYYGSQMGSPSGGGGGAAAAPGSTAFWKGSK